MNKKEKILVLDDNKDWLSTIENLLGEEYDLIKTTSATQARRKVKDNHFVMVILDQRLSNNQKGLQVLSDLRKDAPTLPAIIFTEFPDFQDARESFQAGALDYISKNEKSFIAKLKESINRHKKTEVIKIFLSYQHEDREDVKNLYNKLIASGLLPWMDIKSTIRGEWWPQIQKAIEESDYFIPCFSTDSLRKKKSVFRDELALSLQIQKSLFRSEVFLIPVRLEGCKIPEEFRRFQHVDLFEKGGLAKLIERLS